LSLPSWDQQKTGSIPYRLSLILVVNPIASHLFLYPSMKFTALLLLGIFNAGILVANPLTKSIETLPEGLQKQTPALNPEYLVYSPEATANNAKLPLLIYLHGAGGRGSDIAIAKDKCALALTTAEKAITEPFYFVAPQVIKGNATVWETSELNLFLLNLKATLSIDEDRVYLTGHSMGGYGTWAWAATNPELFAAVAPNAGGLGHGGPTDITPDFDTWAKNLAKVPLWAFHGAMDNTVPADRSESMVEAIRKHGGKQVKLTIYPELGHNSANTTHANPELYHWLLKQHR
jgi:predicted peptidase